MTRRLTVSDLKDGRSHCKTGDGKPKPGTVSRAMYDALRRGERVKPRDYSKNHSIVEQLTNIYGMELEAGGRDGYRLVGEWEGPYFVPLERILQEDQ